MATSSAVGSSSATSTSNLSPAIQQALQGVTIKANKQSLNQDDFLKLLTVQLQNQDPLKPMEDAQFMGQMAQFASLEQTKELNATVTGLTTSLGFASAQQFLGKNVTLNDNGSEVTGTVSGVMLVSGVPQIMVNGKAYTTDKVTAVTLPTPSNPNTSSN
jgi:flagellar basal-body rod modification protein FlgD